MSVKRYTVQYELDEDGWWVATVRGVSGCHTQGRTIRQASERIVEALSSILDADASRYHYNHDVRLPPAIQALVTASADSVQKAAAATKAAEKARKAAVTALQKKGIGLRDAGHLLGISHARVQQISAR